MTMNQLTQTTVPNTAAATSVSPLEQSGSSKTKFVKRKAKPDMYQTVTDNIIRALEAGVKPWVCPWTGSWAASGLPANFSTGTAYSGINIMLLWSSAAELGYTDPRWLTYKQAAEQGGQVRKGEHGTTIIYYKMLEKENEAGETEHIPMLKTFTVFNVQQIDNLAVEYAALPAASFEPIEKAEALTVRSGAKITEKGIQAFYRPSTDEIYLPERFRFNNSADFYATQLHELIHWTGAKSRLNREKGGKYGSDKYAFEELIAELGCAFLMADLGITGDVQHESYISSWLKALNDDKRFIFKAASAASKAHRYLREL
ncbi:ArdC family protein [Morganella morganii]|uniref:ArdC family protein n=1 Tax=Morganella morganii TaxID=582 RepID=UPI0032DBC848